MVCGSGLPREVQGSCTAGQAEAEAEAGAAERPVGLLHGCHMRQWAQPRARQLHGKET